MVGKVMVSEYEMRGLLRDKLGVEPDAKMDYTTSGRDVQLFCLVRK